MLIFFHYFHEEGTWETSPHPDHLGTCSATCVLQLARFWDFAGAWSDASTTSENAGRAALYIFPSLCFGGHISWKSCASKPLDTWTQSHDHYQTWLSTLCIRLIISPSLNKPFGILFKCCTNFLIWPFLVRSMTSSAAGWLETASTLFLWSWQWGK